MVHNETPLSETVRCSEDTSEKFVAKQRSFAPTHRVDAHDLAASS